MPREYWGHAFRPFLPIMSYLASYSVTVMTTISSFSVFYTVDYNTSPIIVSKQYDYDLATKFSDAC